MPIIRLALLLLLAAPLHVIAQQFLDETEEFGLSGFVSGDSGSGVSFVDFNLDTFDDIVLTSEEGFVTFFQNGNGMQFVEVDLGLQVDSAKMTSFVDFDNDGDLDLFCTRLNAPNKLFQKQADGSFLDVSEAMGISTALTPSYGHSWGDIDTDGDLDLYVCNFSGSDVIAVTNTLYRNTGTSFEDISEVASVDNGMNASFMPTFFDITRDGDQDLFVINDRVIFPNALFENNGNGTFSDISFINNMGESFEAMSNSVADYNNDGLFDVYMTNTADGNYLKRNLGFSFTDAAVAAGISLNEFSWGAQWLDYDNDSWQDLVISTGDNPAENAYGATHLFRNVEGGFFQLQTEELTEDLDDNTYSNATADVNHDGKIDFITGSVEGLGLKLWMNASTTGNFIRVSLEGVASNTFGVGAVIEVYSEDYYTAHTVMVGNGYLSQNSYTVHVGMGDKTLAEVIKVTWPNGEEDFYFDINVNQSIILVEGEGVAPIIESSTGAYELCQGDSVELFVGDFEGYSWSTGSTDSTTWVSNPGWITLDVDVAGGTTLSADPVFVSVIELADWTLEQNTPTCFPDTLTSLLLAGPDAGLVEWINPSEAPSYGPGQHSYTLLDPSGCEVHNTILTTAPEEITANYELTLPSCFGLSDGSIVFNPTGGTGMLELTLDCNPDSLSAGICTFEIEDIAGCSISELLIISQPSLLDVEIDADGILDTGLGTLLAVVSGGTEDYSYFWNASEGTDSYEASRAWNCDLGGN